MRWFARNLPGIETHKAADVDLLQQIRIASPCSAAWDEMRGDDRVRFCEQCRLNVYNLSAMSTAEAAALVREKEGRLCTRYYARADGTMLVENCPVGFGAARRMLLAQLGTIAGAFTMLFASIPFLTKERLEALRKSRVGQTEPFRTLFDWLDPQPNIYAWFQGYSSRPHTALELKAYNSAKSVSTTAGGHSARRRHSMTRKHHRRRHTRNR